MCVVLCVMCGHMHMPPCRDIVVLFLCIHIYGLFSLSFCRGMFVLPLRGAWRNC